MNFKATRDELQRSNINIDEKVVRVAGGGYVGVLSVYHELHCLVRFLYCQTSATICILTGAQEALRKSTLRSFYYPNMTIDHDEGTIEHLSKCRLSNPQNA